MHAHLSRTELALELKSSSQGFSRTTDLCCLADSHVHMKKAVMLNL